MKAWIMELCPEIQEWQAELIAEQANHKDTAMRPLADEDIMTLWKECCMRVEGSSRELVLTFAHAIMEKRNATDLHTV